LTDPDDELSSISTAGDAPALLSEVAKGYAALGLYDRPLAFRLNGLMLSAEVARMASFVHRLRGLGLSKATGQYITLRDLYFSEGHCMSHSEIVRRRRVSSPNVTRWMNGLEREGLVSRSIDPKDRRNTLIQLTAEGERLCEWLVPEIAHFIHDIASCLSDDELTQLAGLLERVRAHAEGLTRTPLE
jgi:DNA-binding MarR family transcriptional regulator